ncbi:hypothetical protein CKSOR_00273 [Candidatus Kinetoplastibacterium sorsogonicusi]|uniref:Uncharacterized protein n=1 Tax=Candidatus Kinetoplastidibacterium kentomonadis TaxID=1576550 RepID=A0A3Q8ERH7_9PROT|nr:Trm112 family protein [Candidatus Kinetoplastibacterium sorsogonicusi]AWD32394.1 hypothetical protein CKSOR_00273 [Candidatus Kinetoplastibacterium sorsogonicusi]
MKTNILEVLVCPICKNKFDIDLQNNKLICKLDSIDFYIEDNIPILLKPEDCFMKN